MKTDSEAAVGSPSGGIGYIRPIDGLRAIAVLAVVLYHSLTFLAPSGLVGVDVFFVISGFVVSLSVPSLRATSFLGLLRSFFARRILRIVPALLVCLLVTSALTVVFIPQGHLSETNLDTARAAFFGLSNFVLASTSNGYFATRAELNPFTHTWSLAVEEQFYLIFPLLSGALLFAVTHKWSRAATIALWAALTVSSAAFSAWQSLHEPVAAFYLLPARFWELGVGVLACVLLQPATRRLGSLPDRAIDSIAFASLVVVLASLAFARSGFAYPFPAVAPAVVATAILIWTLVAAPTNTVARILAHRVPSHIGRISYSLYLWHWPLFVLLRWTSGFTTPLRMIAGMAIAFLLAEASYRWVEMPIRRLRSGQWLRSVAVAGCLLMVVASFALTSWVALDPMRFSASVTANRYLWAPEGATEGISRVCDLDIDNQTKTDVVAINFNAVKCQDGVVPRRLFVMGDSHAGAMMRVFIDAAVSAGVSTRFFSLPGCGVLTLLEGSSTVSPACDSFVSQTFATIAQEARAGDVLFLPSLRMRRLQTNEGTLLSDENTMLDPAKISAGRDDALAKLAAFDGTGVHVVFPAPLPVFRIIPYRCADWFNARNPACRAGAGIYRAEFERRRAPIMASLATIAARYPFVYVWDPADTLCDDAGCVAFKDGKPLFYDGDHLSGWSNDLLYQPFIAMLRQLSPTP